MLNRLIACTMLAFVFSFAGAQQIQTPQPSPTQTIRQDFGISYIELTYSRPGKRQRTIFGDLVPYDSLWRTGANAATRIKFGDTVTVGGVKVHPGEYAIYTIPREKEWEVILNRGVSNWGVAGYNREDDVARFKVRTITTPESMETFTMQFANIKPTSTDLRIWWDKTAVVIPITVDIDSRIMKQIDRAMNQDTRPYFTAAMYYLETGKDLEQAVVWFDRAMEQNPRAFWVSHQKANALARLGRKEEALKTAQASMELARQQNSADYVELNRKLIESINKMK